MKRICYLFVFLIFFQLIYAGEIVINENPLEVNIIQETSTGMVLEYSFGRFQTNSVKIGDADYLQLKLGKESNLQKKGFPALPTINRSFIVTDNGSPEIQIIESNFIEFIMDIAPSKGDILRSENPEEIPYTFEEIYREKSFFPEELAELSDPYILRDFRGILVTVNPFSYNPVTRTLRVYHQIKVEITYTGAEPVNPKKPLIDGYCYEFEPIYKSHFLNFSRSRYTPVEEAGRMLVICHEDFLDEMQPYVDWKIQKGIETELVNVDDIGTTAEVIKDYLVTEYNSSAGLTFVQLVGDGYHVPTFFSGSSGLDPFYSLIDGSDDYPDILVGRFSAQVGAHVETQVERTIYYEKNIDNVNWPHYALGVGSNQGPGDDGEYDWQHLDNIRTDLLGYNYTYVGQLYDPGVTDTEVIDEVNAGRGFINYTGHGNNSSWTTSGFNNIDVNNLTNSFMLPFICDVACWNGNFAVTTCFAEAWMRATHNTFGYPTGAIAIWASSISQPWNPPMAAQDEVTDLLVAEDNLTIGGLFFNAGCQMLDDYSSSTYVFEAWNIFGDVSLMVRTDTPTSMTVTHKDYIDPSDSFFIVNTGITGSLACITDQDNNIVDAEYVGSLGYANLDFSAAEPGNELTLTVTAYNKFTYVATIPYYEGNTWLGSFNYYWHNDNNWSYGHIPTAVEDVVIADNGYHPPNVDFYDESCRDLIIYSGAELQIHDFTLNVNSDLLISGNLTLEESSSRINVGGDVIWESGSNANFNADAEISVVGHWNFENGSAIHLDDGSINFTGTTDSWIRFYDNNSYFNNLKISKSSGGTARFSFLSTADPQINGNLYNYNFAALNAPVQFTRTIHLNGFFYNEEEASYSFENGSFEFSGTNPYLGLYTDGDYFHDLIVNCAGTFYLWDNLDIRGDLSITSGNLDFVNNSSVLEIGGNWNNLVGPGGFTQDQNKVVFNGGNYHQYCSDQTFYRLEIDKPDGGAFRVNATEITCAHYLWTAGAVDVLSGSFTAEDLDQSGIYGSFYLNSGGTINIYNTDEYVDLNGDLHVFGGNLNIYGDPSELSRWGWLSPANLEMSGGIIDFKNNGISFASSYPVSVTMTGGTLRTIGNFQINYPGFTPTGGTVELYGDQNAYISSIPDNHFNDLLINKSSTVRTVTDTEPANISLKKTDMRYLPELYTDFAYQPPLILPNSETIAEPHGEKIFSKNRFGEDLITMRDNSALLSSSVIVSGSLNLTNGTLDLASYTLSVAGDMNIYGNVKMTSTSSALYCGSSIGHDLCWYPGSTAEINSGKIYPYYSVSFHNGTDAQFGSGNTFIFTSDCYQSGFWCFDPDVNIGNLTINKSSGEFYIASGSTQPLYLAGNCTVESGNVFHLQEYDMFIDGSMTIADNATVDMASGSELVISDDLNLNGTLDVGVASVLLHGEPFMPASSSLTIEGGSFVCDTPLIISRNWMVIAGNLIMTDGLLETTYNSWYMTTVPKTITGGVIRTGQSFGATGTGVFLPAGGTVEMIGSDSNTLYTYNNNYLYNLTINRENNGSITAYTNLTLKNNLFIQSGSLIINNNLTVNVGGDWINPNGVSGFNPNFGSVVFTGPNESNLIGDTSFYNLKINDPTPGDWKTPMIADGVIIEVLNDLEIISGCLALEDNCTVNILGDLEISSTAGLDLSTGSNQLINLSGDWTDSNADFSQWHGFHPGSSSILSFNGSIDQNFSSGTNQMLANLIIDKPGGNVLINHGLYILNDLTISNGGWFDNAGGLNHYICGDFLVEPNGAWLSSTGTITFADATDQSISYLGATGNLINIVIDKTPDRHEEDADINILTNTKRQENRSQTVTLNSDLIAEGGTISVVEGILDLNGQILSQADGPITISGNGILQVDAGAILRVGDGQTLTVTDGGTIQIIGSSTSHATVTHTGGGYYTFSVEPLGNISAEYGIFEFLDSSGVIIADLAEVDPVKDFDNCIFRNSSLSAGATLLTVENSQNLEISFASFPTVNPDGFNVTKTTDSGNIVFWEASGDFAGEDFEDDLFGRIDWQYSTVTPVENIQIRYHAAEDYLELSWEYTENYSYFNIYRSTAPNFTPATVNLLDSITAKEFHDHDLGNNKYFYKVTVIRN